MIIAIDGPLASGKGTLARALAAHFGLPHLDTGSIYRAVALSVLKSGKSPNDKEAAIGSAQNLDMSGIIDADLRTAEVGAGASIVAAIPEVRKALFDFQRKFASNPKGAVLDGRDIGTVICPDADFKFFITARPEIRAMRRLKELHAAGDNITLEELTKQIEERDYRDANRADAPLKPTETSIILDTSDMGIDEVIQKAVGIVNSQTPPQ
jgi:cytidylate kinase